MLGDKRLRTAALERALLSGQGWQEVHGWLGPVGSTDSPGSIWKTRFQLWGLPPGGPVQRAAGLGDEHIPVADPALALRESQPETRQPGPANWHF